MDATFLIILAVCAVLCIIGFYKFVYFLSVGYGFAVAGSGLTLLLLHGAHLSAATIVICLLFIVYGIRLGGFLVLRELKSASYRKTLDEATGEGKPIPMFVKAAIWICVSIMYVMQMSPVIFRVISGDPCTPTAMLGALIMAIAIAIESISDKQKSKAKQQNPHRFCDTGLFRIVRCPNYFGELLFWTGVFVSGFGAVQGAFAWAVAIIGYILIIYVMLSGAKRLEIRQNKSYGTDPAYQTYVAKTPIILPCVPLYHLEQVGFIVV